MQEPWCAVHPMAKDASVLHRTIPLVVHNDGAESFTDQEMDIWSISSAFVTSGNVWDSKFLSFTIMTDMVPRKALKAKLNHTLCRFYKRSFEHCMSGKLPVCGFNGELFKDNRLRKKKGLVHTSRKVGEDALTVGKVIGRRVFRATAWSVTTVARLFASTVVLLGVL